MTFTKILIKFTLFLFLITTSFANARELAETEKNIARKRIHLAWDLLGPVIYSCLKQESLCYITNEEKNLLTKIATEHKNNNSNALIQFKSGKENPGFFDLNSGTHRLAVTGSTPGSTIYINTDIIDPMTNSLSLSTMISILTHELGHHFGIKDDAERTLDILGNKIAKRFEQNSEILIGEEKSSSKIETILFNPFLNPKLIKNWSDKSIYNTPYIYVTDGERIYTLTNSVPLLLDCAYGTSVRHIWLDTLIWKSKNSIASEETHYCLTSSQKLEVKASFLMTLSLELGSDRFYRFTNEPSIQVLASKNIGFESDKSHKDVLSYPREPSIRPVKELTTLPSQITDGGRWNIEVETTGSPKDYMFCAAMISSEQFELEYASGQSYTFETDGNECEMKRLENGNLLIKTFYDFPETTPKRKYYVKAVYLMPRDVTQGNVYLLPKVRPTVLVSSTKKIIKKEITSIGLYSRGEEATSPRYGFVRNGLCQLFIMDFEIPNGQPIIQSHLKYTIYYKNNAYSPVAIMERMTLNSSHGVSWKKTEEPLSNGNMLYKFDMQFFHQFMAIEEMERIVFNELTVQTSDLQEYKITFPNHKFGLDVFFNIGMHCRSPN
ncbi:MAG: hypothetical protein M9962_02990 [Oligoflexia bacterium]|nr:hypothetical protein [Oligoflexia bacterium]